MNKYLPEAYTIILRFAIILVLMLTIYNQLEAQHFNFSQYNLTPLRVNPGLVGSSSEAMLIFHYRNQNTGAQQNYNSSLFTATMPLVGRGVGAKRWGGLGLSVLDDRIEGPVTFINQTISLNFAYNVYLQPDLMLSMGLQGDYNAKQFSTDGITTGMQYRDWIYNPSSSTGESFENFNTSNFAVSSGFYLYKKDLKNRDRFYTGISFYNLNQPQQSFFDSDGLLPITGIITAGYRVMEKGPFDLTPEILYSTHAGNNIFNFGSVLSYDLDFDPSVNLSGRLDLALRHTLGKTGIIALQYHRPNYIIGFSYDFPVAPSAKPSIQNAMEIVFSIKAPVERGDKVKKKKNKKVKKKKVKKTTKKNPVNNKAPAVKKEVVKKVEKPQVEKIPDTLDVENYEDKELIVGGPQPDEPATGILKVHELLKNFEFDFNQTTIKESSKAYLDELSVLMKNNPAIQLKIVGHTDDIGSVAANNAISLKRAESVKNYLIQKGISGERIVTEGKGKSEPKFPNINDKFRALNRRVEFLIE